MDRRANRRVDADPLPLYRLILTALLLLGAWFRVAALDRDVRLHPDEALYATYARRISRYGDFLLADVPLDKPPLGLILTGAGFSAFGSSEFAARLPTLFLSLITLAVIYRLARNALGRRAAQWAILLLAVSPFDIAFAVTLFHDPALTLWLLAMALSLQRDRFGPAGIFTALALMTKQSAIQFIPFFALIGLAGLRTMPLDRPVIAAFRQRARRFFLPLGIGVILLILWSVARAAPVDFWTLGVNNPGALRFIRADEVLPRLAIWFRYLGWSAGFAPLVLFALIPVWGALRNPARNLSAGLIALTLVSTLLLYWLTAYNAYDRYLHPLIPLLLMLVGAGIACLARPAQWSIVLVVILALPASGSAPLGGDQGAHAGIDQLAAALRQMPPHTVVWDHWLGWELGYYLDINPNAWVFYQLTPESFARAACRLGAPSYLVGPQERLPRWLAALRARRGAAVHAGTFGRFALYHLECSPKPYFIR